MKIAHLKKSFLTTDSSELVFSDYSLPQNNNAYSSLRIKKPVAQHT